MAGANTRHGAMRRSFPAARGGISPARQRQRAIYMANGRADISPNAREPALLRG